MVKRRDTAYAQPNAHTCKFTSQWMSEVVNRIGETIAKANKMEEEYYKAKEKYLKEKEKQNELPRL